ncbi:MAG TPA: hypothetical protein VM324_10440 [Egibacteraceae bacterium]|nr:hypothetical protein [Egibacteraceae bacterium]
MPCQSAPGRVRLTDQALVAVAAARQAGAHHGRHPTAADMLVGLAAEPDGCAGALLRTLPSAALGLVERTRTTPARLPGLEAVVGRAARRQGARAVSTADLLAALLEAGGPDVTDLLDACGYDARALYRAVTGDPAAAHETFGLGSDPDLSVDAAFAVARVRATGGGAVDLLLAIASTGGSQSVLPGGEEELAGRLAGLWEDGEPARTGPDWDLGLEAVLAAARAMVAPPIDALDLVRAALLAGGQGPGRLLENAQPPQPRASRSPQPPSERGTA